MQDLRVLQKTWRVVWLSGEQKPQVRNVWGARRKEASSYCKLPWTGNNGLALHCWMLAVVVVVAGESQKQSRPDLTGKHFAAPTSTSASIKVELLISATTTTCLRSIGIVLLLC